MITGYSYDLWNGKEVVGKYHSMFPIKGQFLIIPEETEFKRSYRKKYRQHKFIMSSLVIHDDGVSFTVKRVIDVRRKSKRQINLLRGNR